MAPECAVHSHREHRFAQRQYFSLSEESFRSKAIVCISSQGAVGTEHYQYLMKFKGQCSISNQRQPYLLKYERRSR
jgi:hypothetical protein